jgi:hypothetical protein
MLAVQSSCYDLHSTNTNNKPALLVPMSVAIYFSRYLAYQLVRK